MIPAVRRIASPRFISRIQSRSTFIRTMSGTPPIPPLPAGAAQGEQSSGLAPTTTIPEPRPELPRFPLTSIPVGAKPVRTAACLIIGDEILNGKTRDTNTNYLAKLLFDVGVELKRIEVISDEEDEIIEAARRLSRTYDVVFTSGGIGPTLDDITYPSLAAAFTKGELEYDQETIKRMGAMNSRARGEQNEEQKTARLRMALFPKGSVPFFVHEELWVPVVRVNGNVYILPGVPTLFERLLTGLVSRFISLPPASEKPFRVLVHTAMPESNIAPYLLRLHEKVKGEGIRVGSYPKFGVGVDVSLIGKDPERLKVLADEVVAELMGKLVLTGKLGEEKEVVTPTSKI